MGSRGWRSFGWGWADSGVEADFAQGDVGGDVHDELGFDEEAEVGVAAVEGVGFGSCLARVLGEEFESGDAGAVDGLQRDGAEVVIAPFEFELQRLIDDGEIVAEIVFAELLHDDAVVLPSLLIVRRTRSGVLLPRRAERGGRRGSPRGTAMRPSWTSASSR